MKDADHPGLTLDPDPPVGPRVAVCIVTYEAARDLATCFAALREVRHRPLEVVVVDCGSQDTSVELARELSLPFPKQVLPLGENRGFAGGMNAAIAATDAPYLLCLNADASLEPDTLSHLVARAELHPRLAAVTPRLVRPADAEGPRLDACGMVLTRTWRHLDRGSSERDTGQYAEAEWVFGGTGAVLLLRRAALEDCQLRDELAPAGAYFDPLFFAYREDAELAFRLLARGWYCAYEPRARATHRRQVLPQGRRQVAPLINYHSLKNRYLLRIYHQTRANFWSTFFPTAFRDLQALLYVLLFEWSSWPAYRFLWRHRQALWRRRQQLAARFAGDPRHLETFFRQQTQPWAALPPG